MVYPVTSCHCPVTIIVIPKTNKENGAITAHRHVTNYLMKLCYGSSKNTNTVTTITA